MELIHYDGTWVGIGGPTEFGDEEEWDEDFEERLTVKRRAISINRADINK